GHDFVERAADRQRLYHLRPLQVLGQEAILRGTELEETDGGDHEMVAPPVAVGAVQQAERKRFDDLHPGPHMMILIAGRLMSGPDISVFTRPDAAVTVTPLESVTDISVAFILTISSAMLMLVSVL